MKVFCTGASGYIGGSVAAHLVAAGHQVTGLVRSQEKADAVRARGIQPLLGTLDDAERLVQAARAADIVVNAASADHKGAVTALLDALAGSGKPFIHTSGSSIVGTRSRGHRSDAVFDESSAITPSPARAARVALNDLILSWRDKGCRPVIICPSLIYGLGLGVEQHSTQVPLLIDLAKKRGCAAHAGPGENIWSNVHIDDLVTLYALAIEKAPAGAFCFAENGENSMREVCEAINRMLGLAGPPTAMSMEEAAAEWGEGTAEDTMASNSRVRAVRARQLGWKPKARSLIEEIEQGCYR
ncbi:NAD-dependent epimerase/dehydratase family protein [Bradyrhizobium sp. KBS0727]|uniref:NAD-dependent epimerase/dehydratase family protein n=1 Tax=unclassified Bradyrhizobium TaxID=2631580 RepID=UPI00110D520A|nr:MULTISPECIES: NAD-dependent epimerase/dehydratase family protein [unclassified Bradyrhizobium]QDW37076.1 NAD-dependent epimerase/dehydratase family protein [Bradyrhizobium sp. KBS0725]QDW43676.1 NAD-dependent epimerase/dehydratase family protein [Bradyrhizobium sp. KBS0727]